MKTKGHIIYYWCPVNLFHHLLHPPNHRHLEQIVIGRGPRNATMCKKPERLHILETGGEALGQNNGIISYAPAWKAVPLRLIVLPSRQRGSGCSLIPRASPPVSKMYSLPGLRCNGLYSAAKQSGRIYRTLIIYFCASRAFCVRELLFCQKFSQWDAFWRRFLGAAALRATEGGKWA